MSALGSSRFLVVSPGLVVAGNNVGFSQMPVKSFYGPLDDDVRVRFQTALLGHVLRHPDQTAVGVSFQDVSYIHSGCLRVLIETSHTLHLTSRVLMLGEIDAGLHRVFCSASDVLSDELFSDDRERDSYLSALSSLHNVA